jgi:anti-sigma regulatory factor (Ser/Thr protein kinase)
VRLEDLGNLPFGALPADASAPAAARAAVRRACPQFNGRDALADVLLMTSEAVTNALQHGQPPIELAVHCGDALLCVAVRNVGRAPRLAVRRPAHEEERGRGLRLIDALSKEWAHQSSAQVTTVWFAVPVPR